VPATTRANGAFTSWTDMHGPGNGLIVGVPAAGVDKNGLAVLVAIGLDGGLYADRELVDGSFSGWTTMG
jgi:hypothetical protein